MEKMGRGPRREKPAAVRMTSNGLDKLRSPRIKASNNCKEPASPSELTLVGRCFSLMFIWCFLPYYNLRNVGMSLLFNFYGWSQPDTQLGGLELIRYLVLRPKYVGLIFGVVVVGLTVVVLPVSAERGRHINNHSLLM